MAIHVKLRSRARRTFMRSYRLLRLRSFLISLVFCVLAFLVLYFTRELILSGSWTSFLFFPGESAEAPAEVQESKVDRTTGASSSPAADVSPESPILVADEIATHFVPMEEVRLDVLGSNKEMGDVSGFDGLELAEGLGEGLSLGYSDGMGGGGMGSSTKNSSCLVGTLYDLKKLSDGGDSQFKDAIENLEVLRFLSAFYRQNWLPETLDKFYQSPVHLYSTCFYMPNTLDSEAPHAYQCSDKMKPSRWVAVYRGRVRAPKSGKFRFWGIGDTVLAVRFNHRNVLACGFHSLEKGTWNTHRLECYEQNREILSYDEIAYWNRLFSQHTYESLFFLPDETYNFKEKVKRRCPTGEYEEVEQEYPVYEGGFLDPGKARKVIGTAKKKVKILKYSDETTDEEWDRSFPLCEVLHALRYDLMQTSTLLGGLEAGEEFEVRQGEWYDIEVMVSEIGGGNFGFCLLTEDLGDGYQRYDSKKRPLFQLFRTAYVNPDAKEIYDTLHFKIPEEEHTYPPYDPDSLIWVADTEPMPEQILDSGKKDKKNRKSSSGRKK